MHCVVLAEKYEVVAFMQRMVAKQVGMDKRSIFAMNVCVI